MFISVVSSSNANRISAPSECWMRMDTSGEKRCRDPSRCEVKVTPSSSTFASRPCALLVAASSGVAPADISMTFLNPTPRLITWKPPESV